MDIAETDERKLLTAIKERLPQLEKMLAEVSDHWGYEGPIYRFYHQSFKVYGLQAVTQGIVSELMRLAPGLKLNEWFGEILAEGTGKVFDQSHNRSWLLHTRPIVEAFFHARYFLEMAVRSAREIGDTPPAIMPSSWAGLLCLYRLR